DFKDMIQVGTRGSSNEQGLQATNSFASKYGSNFFRDDAYLVIVIVSDEDDSSPQSVADHMNYLMGLKSQSSLVKTYTIVDTSGTQKSSWYHTAGYARYGEATSITGGTTSSIHDDFHNTLLEMGESVANLAQSFALSGVPVAGSIEVLV